jgi:hypothetical protein
MTGFKQVTKAQARTHLSRDERIERLNSVVAELETREEFVIEISRLWGDAQNTFLTIGRYLVQAAGRLKHGEYQAMVENELPFGYTVSYQLRRVAEAIDSGRLPGADLPPNYSTIYQLTTLNDEQLQLAQSHVPTLIRPTVKREDIVQFKRGLAKAKPPAVPRTGQLEKRRKTLLAQIEKLQANLADIEQQLEGIEG